MLYISKNAIDDVPVAGTTPNGDGDGTKLQNSLLASSPYLVGLAQSDTAFASLRQGMSNEAVRLIKVALNTLSSLEIYPNLTLPELDYNSFNFDPSLKQAVVIFQTWAGIIPVDGIVDRKTLLSIDSKFFGDEFYNREKTKYIGKSSDVKLTPYQEFEDGKFKYKLRISEDSPAINIETPTILEGEFIKKGSNFIDNNNRVNLKLSNNSKVALFQNNPVIKNIVKQKDPDSIEIPGMHIQSVTLDAEDTFINLDSSSAPLFLAMVELDQEVANTPPKMFDDPDATVYKVQSTDSFSDIVLQNYYGTGGYDIIDPYTNTVIFTFENRTPFNVPDRAEDARFQFYLNLLYYYNTQEIDGQPLQEWGMKKNGDYERYQVNHLNDVNIFDNTFDASDPNTQSGLPNYYRFLKRMEALNSNSKIEFDSNGEAISFAPGAGKNIIIPSRKFADSMYNFLNYRHDEMLKPVTVPPENPGDEPTSIMDFVTGLALDLVITEMTATSIFDQIVDAVKEEAIELYNEVADFFEKAYNFAIDSLTSAWPRGLGGKIEIGADITWGIPISTGLVYNQMLWREMSKEKELIIKFSKEFQLSIGAEEIVGTNIGLFSGHGRKKKGLGLKVGAGAAGKTQFKVATEYEFPIRKEETALLTMIITVFAGTMVKATVEVLNYFNVINLDSRQYLSKLEVELEVEVSAWAAAEIGFKNGTGDGNSQVPIASAANNEVQSTTDQNNEGSFGYIDNFFKHLPGIGVNGNASVSTGVGFTYEVAYDNNPKISSKDARVFSSIDLEVKFFTKAELKTGLMGTFLQKLFINSIAPTNPFFVDFSSGLELGFQWHYERKDLAENLSVGDLTLTDPGIPFVVSAISGGNLQFDTNSTKVVRQLRIFCGTGGLDTLCEPGTETKLLLNAGLLKAMWTQSPSFNFTLENVLDVLVEFEYKKKIGIFDYNSLKRKTLKEKKKMVPDKNLTGQVVDAHERSPGSDEGDAIKYVLSSAKSFSKKHTLGFFGALALDIGITLKMEELKPIFKFHLRKIYYKYNLATGARAAFETRINNQRKKIDTQITKKVKFDNGVFPTGMDYYNLLYSANIENPGTQYEFKGLNYFIDEIITNNPSPVDYAAALRRFIVGYKPFNEYLDNIKPKENNLDFGIDDIIDAFSFLAGISNFEATLEAKAGFDVGGQVAVGAEGLTAKIALSGMAEINYQGKLFENGQLTDLEITDPLRYAMQEISKILLNPGEDKRIGAKSILPLLDK